MTDQAKRTANNENAVKHADWILGPGGNPLAVIETPNPLPGLRQDRENFAPKFGIGMRLVSHGEFGEFAKQTGLQRPDSTYQRPARSVSFYDAAAYCNWLSERSNIPLDQWCFEESQANDGKLEPAPDYLLRVGYRIPIPRGSDVGIAQALE